MHAYPPIKPKQVHLRCVPLTSYRFLPTLPLASNALASRIIFPSVGAIQVSFNLTDLPASLGKQKREDSLLPLPSLPPLTPLLVTFELAPVNRIFFFRQH
ncbi:hypothetical protein BZG18_02945 [Salinivibrio kushneri]|nr:hypothetical protein BZG18_02945 [Salinivibrio kushneri]